MLCVKPSINLLSVLILSGLPALTHAVSATPQDIPYRTVATALEDLSKQAKVTPGKVRMQTSPDGWQMVYQNINNHMVVWSFTPAKAAAYPAVVRREVRDTRQQLGIQMSILCEAPQAACDGLLATFKRMNLEGADADKLPSSLAITATTSDSKMNSGAQGTAGNQPIIVNNASDKAAPDKAAQEKAALQVNQDYWQHVEKQQYTAAYGLFSASLQTDMPFQAWKDAEQQLSKRIGEAKGQPSYQLTLQQDPSPLQLGLYATIDFAAPHQFAERCGHSVWKQQPNGQFQLQRIKSNFIEYQPLLGQPQSKMDDLKKQLGCRL